jgi:hypothetical protein
MAKLLRENRRSQRSKFSGIVRKIDEKARGRGPSFGQRFAVEAEADHEQQPVLEAADRRADRA